jgi:hypothetical protein
VLRTRSPLYSGTEAPFLVRLACVKYAASVRSEPGSNSPYRIFRETISSLSTHGALSCRCRSSIQFSKSRFLFRDNQIPGKISWYSWKISSVVRTTFPASASKTVPTVSLLSPQRISQTLREDSRGNLEGGMIPQTSFSVKRTSAEDQGKRI